MKFSFTSDLTIEGRTHPTAVAYDVTRSDLFLFPMVVDVARESISLVRRETVLQLIEPKFDRIDEILESSATIDYFILKISCDTCASFISVVAATQLILLCFAKQALHW